LSRSAASHSRRCRAPIGPSRCVSTATPRALVDAGFMPLSRYIQMFEGHDDEPSCIAEVEH
jgi:hypothetical protein